MSVLQCSNIHFESTANTRLQYDGSNSFLMVAAGQTIATVNTSGVAFTNTNLTLTNVASTTNTFTVGTATYFVANGNLGIGINTPNHKLLVNGTAYVMSNFYVGTTGNASITASGRTLNLGDGDETVSCDAAAGGFSYLVRESTGTIQLSARGGGAINAIKLIGNTVSIGSATASLYTVANGNIGIGTSSPSYKLDIAGTARIGVGTSPYLWIGDASGNYSGGIRLLVSNNQTNWAIGADDLVTNTFTITPSTVGGGSTFTTPAVSISPNGYFGIGTGSNSPLSKLTVMSNTNNIMVIGSTSGGGNQPGIDFVTNPNTPTTWRAAQIYSYDTGISYGGGLIFKTNPGNSASFGTEAMRIDHNGNVGIGGAPSYKLDVQGSSGIIVGRINATDGSMTRLTLENSKRIWTISNYGTQIGSNGDFAIADETGVAVRFKIDGNIGNIALNGTSYPWGVWYQPGIDYGFSGYGSLSCRADFNVLGQNIYMNSNGNWVYKITNNYGYMYNQTGGNHIFYTAPNNGAANANATLIPYMGIDASGRVTKPYQPAFLASGGGQGTITTNIGNPLALNNAAHNIGNYYNTSTYAFTAPVAGMYQFFFNIYTQNGANVKSISWRKNGSDHIFGGDTAISFQGSTNISDLTVTGSVIMQLAANDYVQVGVRSIGSANLTWYAGHSWWYGYLIG